MFRAKPLCPALPSDLAPLMPPNFLPLIGNGARCIGVALRLTHPEGRAGRKGSFDGRLPLYHGGAIWLPWGGKLARGILFYRLGVAETASSQTAVTPKRAHRLDAATRR